MKESIKITYIIASTLILLAIMGTYVVFNIYPISSEKIITVCIRVGDLRDFVEEITQKYWDYLSIGTIAYGAKIKFERVPVSAICNNCENIFYFDWHDEDKPCCTKCGNFDNRLITGMELEVKEISIL